MAIATLDTYNSLPAVKAVRRARRAYVGLWVMAFERAAERVDILRAKGDDLLVDFAARGAQMEGAAKTAFADVKTKAEDIAEDGVDAVKNMIPVKPLSKKAAKIAALEAELAALNAALKTGAKSKTAKSKTAKPKAVKAKAATAAMVETADKYAAYVEKVAVYDTDVDAAYVRAIVRHLGIALSTRDGQLVACSDAAERDVVRDSWLVKKLGVSGDAETLDAKVQSVCKAMKADRMKNRVVFYYLLAKQEGKLAAL